MNEVEDKWKIICEEAKLLKGRTNKNEDEIPDWYDEKKFDESIKHMRNNFLGKYIYLKDYTDGPTQIFHQATVSFYYIRIGDINLNNHTKIYQDINFFVTVRGRQI